MNEGDDNALRWGRVPAVECPAGYPVKLEQYVDLRNGCRLFARPVVPADEQIIEQELRDADTETLYQRFFITQPRLGARRRHSLVNIDYQWRLALVVFAENGEAVGIGRYEGGPGQEEAEIAFVVKPGWRRLGLSSALLHLLAKAAQARGITRLTAICLPDNDAMTALLSSSGFELLPPQEGIIVARKTL